MKPTATRFQNTGSESAGSAGRQLTALRLLAWEDVPGGGACNTGFHALNSGATSFVPSATTEANFLGGDHLNTVASGTDLLPELSDGDTAGIGFSVPLGPGTYSYVIQQTGPQKCRYGLEFVVAAPAPVPAWTGRSALLMGMLLGAAGVLVLRYHERRRHRGAAVVVQNVGAFETRRS